MAVKGRNGSAPGAPRLLDQLRERVRFLHYSLRTEKAYVYCPAYTRRIPTVLTAAEVSDLLGAMGEPVSLIARLLYGTGMRHARRGIRSDAY